MARYFAELAYNGKNYHGWQIQPNARSVQEQINKALSLVLGTEINVVGAGRTDSGVHARFYVLHFDVEVAIDPLFLVYKLNSILPHDISFYKMYEVNSSLHARFDALSRTYEYHVVLNKDPFLYESATRLSRVPNFELMNTVAMRLYDFKDFTSFSKLHTDVMTNNCCVSEAVWVSVTENHWYFTITADRFLRNMVRAIVGTLLEVGCGKLNEADFVAIIEAKNRNNAGQSVPAQGLYLVDIKY